MWLDLEEALEEAFGELRFQPSASLGLHVRKYVKSSKDNVAAVDAWRRLNRAHVNELRRKRAARPEDKAKKKAEYAAYMAKPGKREMKRKKDAAYRLRKKEKQNAELGTRT